MRCPSPGCCREGAGVANIYNCCPVAALITPGPHHANPGAAPRHGREASAETIGWRRQACIPERGRAGLAELVSPMERSGARLILVVALVLAVAAADATQVTTRRGSAAATTASRPAAAAGPRMPPPHPTTHPPPHTPPPTPPHTLPPAPRRSPCAARPPRRVRSPIPRSPACCASLAATGRSRTRPSPAELPSSITGPWSWWGGAAAAPPQREHQHQQQQGMPLSRLSPKSTSTEPA
jgi:hypothetical protein